MLASRWHEVGRKSAVLLFTIVLITCYSSPHAFGVTGLTASTSILPTSGPPGTSVTWTATGASPGATGTVSVSGTGFSLFTEPFTVSYSGTASAGPFPIPLTATPGTLVTISATDSASDTFPTKTFSVTQILSIGDAVIWRPSTGVWFILHPDGSSWTVGWGATGDTPLLGKTSSTSSYDLIVFRSGVWYILTASSGYTSGKAIAWGTAGDTPLVDGVGDLMIFRSGVWYILTASSGYTTGKAIGWGTAGDTPLVDGAGDLIIFHSGVWYILTASSSYTSGKAIAWGTAGDTPLADYGGDLLIFRSGVWYILTASSSYTSGKAIGWGTAGDRPLVDGAADLVIFRSGVWYDLTASSNYKSSTSLGWGTGTDTPLVAD